MGFFVKLYDNVASSKLLGIIDDSLSDALFGVGQVSQSGLFVKTNGNGDLQMAKQYSILKNTVFFKTGVRADNGDFLLHGSLVLSAARNKTVIARVSSTGSVLWCKSYAQTNTKENIRLIKSEKDTYFFTSWYEHAVADERVELVKINGTGTVLKTVQIATHSNQMVHDVKSDGSGVLVYGGTTVNDFQSFIFSFDSNLTQNWAKLYKHQFSHQIVDLVRRDAKTLVVIGDIHKQASFIGIIDPNNTTHSVSSFDYFSGDETGPKRIIKTSTAYYVLQYSKQQQKSIVCKFDSSLTLQWEKELDIQGTTILLDILNDGTIDDEVAVVGYQNESELDSLLIAHTNKDFESCSTVTLESPRGISEQLDSSDWVGKLPAPEMTVSSEEMSSSDLTYVENRICPSTSLQLEGNVMFQSPYIYLDAAGSDQSDDSVEGFHLRWDLLRNLGETHLPKGDYSAAGGSYPTNIGYNREDDYVRIFKTPFNMAYYVDVNFSVVPDVITEVGLDRVWRYNSFQPIAADPSFTTDVEVTFENRAQYDMTRVNHNPSTSPANFVSNYLGIITVRIVDKLFFAAEFTLGQGASNLRVETVKISDPLDVETRKVSTRKVLTFATNETIFCDNVDALRFDYDGDSVPTKIRLIAYDDFIYGKNIEGAWSYINQFALDDGNTDTNASVFKRLEDDTLYNLDGKWRKYNEPDVNAVGEFRVNVDNYKSRWTMTEGLKEAVVTYLDTSITDVKAVVTHTNNDPIANDSSMDISYLDMLNFVSLDYHVARMLGLGHIDFNDTSSEEEQFVYLMHYVTEAQLEQEAPDTVQHYYMTPPISKEDHKLPPVPVQKPVTYGIYVDNHTGSPTLLTDEQGYNPYGASRYIQINREEFQFEKELETFFENSTQFSLCSQSVAVLLGLEYAESLISDGNPFNRPEITNDPSWQDLGGLPEVTGIPLTAGERVYIHEETTEGEHHYALYSINWFSRVSQISNKEETDYTTFPPVNTLLPPTNFNVQLIQEEAPLIFTTQQEQDDLDAIVDADKTYVRITFDWNEVHNKAYQTADGVELFWRQSSPLIVQGKIDSGAGAIVEDPVAKTVTVKTTGYLNASVNQVVTPVIDSLDVARFIGARLTIDGEAFEILDIITSGTNPEIKLKQKRVTASQDVNNNNIFSTTESWISPEEDQRFFIAENLDSGASWDEQLAATVSIEQFSSHTELVTHSDGTTETLDIGGLTGSGTIVDIADPDPNIMSYVPAGGPAQVPTGVYTITFDTELLPAHPNGDPNAIVDYVGGTVRVLDANNEMKRLVVWKIKESGGVTVLTAFDATFGLERDANNDFVLTGSDFTPLDGYTPIQTGTVSIINFHPSYRVYVYKSAGLFINDNILPSDGEGTRTSYMAARSIDSTITPTALASYMTPPAGLLAREIRELVAPGVPTGPLFATRPNFYGKATYTFDVQVDNPFALIFYRANERRILDQLYEPAHVDEILDELSSLTSPDVDFMQDRWNDLVNMNIDTITNTFKEYTPGGYRFPMPSNDGYLIPHADPTVVEAPFPTKQEQQTQPYDFADTYSYTDSNPAIGLVTQTYFQITKDCIDGAFLPLTEIPAIYKQLQDTEFQTTGREPVLRNPQTGARYTKDDPEFDPWPMAFRYEKNGGGTILQDGDTGYEDLTNDRFVRFTDYTLDGAASNIYFYFAVELSNTLAVSDRSPVSGPIQLVNSGPAEAPEIRKVVTNLKVPGTSQKNSILFELNEFQESENIKEFKLYRTIDSQKALSVRTMDLVRTIGVGYDLIDDFSDKTFPLFGEPLFYRIVALREISNEQGSLEMIPSKSSNVALINVVDNLNPVAPDLSFHHDPPSGSPLEITNVNISFLQSTYNAIYRLYKQNTQGNWKMIHEIDPNVHNNDVLVNVDLFDTTLGSSTLPKRDATGEPIYHRFRVDVENSSGLVNLKRNEFSL
ncbi:MAG: hypothetical protein HWE22_10385 [Flavobacteriales bacterium]|nr:hypothetical protein [Flavobacteriales bacterium]